MSTHSDTYSSSLLRSRAPARSNKFNEATAYGVITKLAKRSSPARVRRAPLYVGPSLELTLEVARRRLEPVEVD